jgi:hypothetical protein
MATSLRVTRSRSRPAEYVDALAELATRFQVAKAVLDDAEESHRQVQAEILSLMAAHGVKTSTVKLADARYRLTAVQGERLDVDEPGLRKALSAPVYDKLCALKLDRTKLELAIADGRIDPIVVASHTHHRQNRPYVKLSVVQGSEQ